MRINTNGYRPSHRNKWLLLQNKIITKDELLLFEFYLDQMDFDVRHLNYNTFKVNFSQIALLFGYRVNQTNNSIRTKHNKLLKLGFIHATKEKNTFSIHNPERYIAQTAKWKGLVEDFRKSEMNQPTEKIIQNIATNIQLDETNLQPIEKKERFSVNKTTPRSLVSSKVESKFVNNRTISLAEKKSHYQKDTKKGKYSGLTLEDMNWIEDNQ